MDGDPDKDDAAPEDQYTAPSDEYTGGGADVGAEEEEDTSAGQDELNSLDALHKSLMDSISSVYGGQDAQESWTGTPAVGLSAFQGHRQDRAPSYNIRGQLRGFRSAPGAPTASPPEGLTGGQALQFGNSGVGLGAALTPTDQWRKLFPTSPASTSTPAAGPRAPVLSRMGTTGNFSSSYQGGTANNGGFVY